MTPTARKYIKQAITYIQGQAETDTWTSGNANWPLLNALRKLDGQKPVTPKNSPVAADFVRVSR